ncbi:MAG: hypothetical protein Q9167_002499 [Letrouitia subvulpina]
MSPTAPDTDERAGPVLVNDKGKSQQLSDIPSHGDSVDTNLDRGSTPQLVEETSIETAPPPLYGGNYGQVNLEHGGFDTFAQTANDGRVNISINQRSRRLSDVLAPALRSQLDLQHAGEYRPTEEIPSVPSGLRRDKSPPPLNVVVQVVGSRGDVQPFVALGKVLTDEHGHRVRLATHSTFKNFVEENGLEFYDIGGDPAELMAFMVKNPGMMPGMDTLRSGEIGKRRKMMYEIVKGCWRSCIEIGDGTGLNASNGHPGSGDHASRPFVADAIIANPPSFAHIHCAEKLGIPLHLMFTMPWSPTQAFPHPLANVRSSNADPHITNFVSYALVEIMTWQGLGDVINRFRQKTLGLEPVSLMWAPGMANRLRIPYTYCWSPALIPKPKDWGPHIALSGFYFLSLASHFEPDKELEAFLNAGDMPIYIGFGSIVVDDPDKMTELIFNAVKKSGQRALISKGWGGLGTGGLGKPEGIFLVDNVPHDWLFRRVTCVIHHGGAGTTAAGIALGKPTVVVPFFGDQPFWGSMVAKAGAGPMPIPHKELTSDNLAAAIKEALKPEVLQKAQKLGASISSERGADAGAQDFHDKLNADSLRCTVIPARAAVWRVRRTNIRLSAFAAAVLANEGLIDSERLKFYRPREYDSDDGPWDPITGATSALIGTIGNLMMGVADFPVETLRALGMKPSKKHDVSSGSEAPLSLRTSASSSGPVISPTSSMTESLHGNSKDPDSASTKTDSIKDELYPHLSSKKTDLSYDTNQNLTAQPEHPSGGQPGHMPLEAALETGKGIGRMIEAGLRTPMEFTLSLAKGFHNAPKLYGDETVRTADRVTGIKSGLKTAGKEFRFGIYDGITGLIKQPYHGAKEGGLAGLIKGLGRGIGGIVLKPQAAYWALPGYTFMGIYKEVQKHFGPSDQNYIIAARTAQGFEELSNSTEAERMEVIHRWQATLLELEKQTKSHRHRCH